MSASQSNYLGIINPPWRWEQQQPQPWGCLWGLNPWMCRNGFSRVGFHTWGSHRDGVVPVIDGFGVWDARLSMGFSSSVVSSHPPPNAQILGLLGQVLGVDFDPWSTNRKTNGPLWWVQLIIHQNLHFLIKNSSFLPTLQSQLSAGATGAGHSFVLVPLSSPRDHQGEIVPRRRARRAQICSWIHS